MIRDIGKWRRFEKQEIASSPVDYFRNLQIFEALYREAVELGVFPGQESIEVIKEKVSHLRLPYVQRAA
ncbi:MAG: hypothetical protein A2293_01590 [Elusimicrobia bacterium RIFOXYB2_FULL_49_7]|nr:MAG: hypothetical protein A2293_01590 [Elusimicrobia bacterium RIFOXYB2_FULL_49_7]